MDAADSPSLFSRKGFYGALMDGPAREHFRTQLSGSWTYCRCSTRRPGFAPSQSIWTMMR
jgi:hypothetical protein